MSTCDFCKSVCRYWCYSVSVGVAGAQKTGRAVIGLSKALRSGSELRGLLLVG